MNHRSRVPETRSQPAMAPPLLSRVKENEWGRLVGTAAFSFIGRAAGDTSSVLGRMWTFHTPSSDKPTNLLLPCPRGCPGDRDLTAVIGAVRPYRGWVPYQN